MNNPTTMECDGSSRGLYGELKNVHWGKYVDYAEVTCEIKNGILKMVYVKHSIKDT